MKRTTRRVRWYQNTTGDEGLSVRLKFDDQYGEINRFYTDRATATRVYEAYIAGEFTTWDLMQDYDPSCEHDYKHERSVLVYCTYCNKTHAVKPSEKPCTPGAWIDPAPLSWPPRPS